MGIGPIGATSKNVNPFFLLLQVRDVSFAYPARAEAPVLRELTLMLPQVWERVCTQCSDYSSYQARNPDLASL